MLPWSHLTPWLEETGGYGDGEAQVTALRGWGKVPRSQGQPPGTAGKRWDPQTDRCEAVRRASDLRELRSELLPGPSPCVGSGRLSARPGRLSGDSRTTELGGPLQEGNRAVTPQQAADTPAFPRVVLRGCSHASGVQCVLA